MHWTARRRVQWVGPWILALIAWITPAPAAGGVVEVLVDGREAVLGGRPFGDAGPYEKIVGRIRFAFDPDNPANRGIVDLDLAPRNADGLVEAWANFMVLQPADPALRRGVAWVEVSNRGGKASLRYFNAGSGARDPRTPEDFGNGLLMRQGLTLIWVGWQWSIPEGNDAMRLVGPILTEADGTPVTGLVRADWTVDQETDVLRLAHRPGILAYPPADPESPEDVLTVRDGRDERRRTIPREAWRFAPTPTPAAEQVAASEPPPSEPTPDTAAEAGAAGGAAAAAADTGTPPDTAGAGERAIARRGTANWAQGGPRGRRGRPAASTEDAPLTHVQLDSGFEAGRIYELVYRGTDARVVGLGLAAIRDIIAYAKHDPDALFPVEKGVAFGVSQTGRFLRHFLYQGFNVDEEGRTAYDGMLIHTAGAGRGSFNHRFGQPSRDAHRYSAFFFPTDLFPFTSREEKDPVTGWEDGLLERTPEEHRPLTFYTNTGYEYWGRAAALIHHTPDGTADVAPLPNERIYHLTGGQHFVGAWPPPDEARMNAGVRGNPVDFLLNLRALAVALVAWVDEGVEPPASAFPTLADGSLVPFDRVQYPFVPGLVVNRVIHTAYRVDYGEGWDEGIVDEQPPRVGAPFPGLVSDVDARGNEVAGIRPVEVRVPLGTFLPWNLREGAPGATHEMTDFLGTFVPFAATENVKMIRADPRPSLESLYGSRNGFIERLRAAAREMIQERLMLEEDMDRVLSRGVGMWNWVMGG